MSIRVAINGFGRIGRMVFRAGLANENVEFVGINDLTDPSTLAHLLKYDSAQGILNADVTNTDQSLVVNGKEIRIFVERDPAGIPWDTVGAASSDSTSSSVNDCGSARPIFGMAMLAVGSSPITPSRSRYL